MLIMKTLVKKIRIWYLRRIKWRNYKFGKDFYVGVRVSLWARDELKIGDNFYMGKDSQIETDCIIGDNVMIGNKVGIVGKYDHDYQRIGVPIRLAPRIRDKDYDWKGLDQRTIIEDDVWIGYGATIMGGITLKKGCIIAAGSLVTKDTEAYSIYGGNPARKISDRFNTKEDLEAHIKAEASSLHIKAKL